MSSVVAFRLMETGDGFFFVSLFFSFRMAKTAEGEIGKKTPEVVIHFNVIGPSLISVKLFLHNC